jgi:hypothetical protein
MALKPLYSGPATTSSDLFLTVRLSFSLINHKEDEAGIYVQEVHVMQLEQANPTYTRDLGNHLLLRWSRASDTENLVQHIGATFRDTPDAASNSMLELYIRKLMAGDHPFMGPDDFAVVEHTKKRGNPIISCSCLWRHQWDYAGVSLAVSRPEFVATNFGYRQHGCVRHLFELLHARSQAEGHLVQCIQGIPYFYHQFGYEYALEVGAGCTITLPDTPAAEYEGQMVRAATLEDIPLIQQWYARQKTGYAITTNFTEEWLSYQILTQPSADAFISFWLLLDAAETPRGFVALQNTALAQPHHAIAKENIVIVALGFATDVKGMSHDEAGTSLPTLLNMLVWEQVHKGGGDPTLKRGLSIPSRTFTFLLGKGHPYYAMLEQQYSISSITPHAWYIRVGNMGALLRKIAGVLESRMAHSPWRGYSGEVKLYFYRGGIRCVFMQGRLVAVEDWTRSLWYADDDISIPPDIFLQLLFGYRSLFELRALYLDIVVKGEKAPLLDLLFPSQLSWALPLG